MVRPRAVRIEIGAPREVSLAGKRTDVPDEELVERMRAGHRWAEEAIFRKHVDYVTALSFRLLRDWTEAKDVVQDTFLDAFTALHRGTIPTSLRAWIAGVAVHKVHRRFRTRRVLSLFGRASAVEDAVLVTCARPSTSPELIAELSLLDSALGRLADVDRAAWVLRYVEGYALDEVARSSGCSLATAKRRLRRAHAVVQAHVDLECEEVGHE